MFCIENSLDQQPLSHTQALPNNWFSASYLRVGGQRKRGVLTIWKKEKETGTTDTAELSTVAMAGTTTRHGLHSQAARWPSLRLAWATSLLWTPRSGPSGCHSRDRVRPGPHPTALPCLQNGGFCMLILRNATQKQLRKLTVYMQWL